MKHLALLFLLAAPAWAQTSNWKHNGMETYEVGIDVAIGDHVGPSGPWFDASIFGHSDSLSGTDSLITNNAGVYWRPTTAATVELFALNAADTLLGLGCQQALVKGLDENWDQAEEIIDLNGTSASAASTTTFFRAWLVQCVRAGTYGGSNIGAIEARVSGAGATIVVMEPSQGISEMAAATVPAGFTCFLMDTFFGIAPGNSSVELLVVLYLDVDDVVGPAFAGARLVTHRWPGLMTPVQFDFQSPPGLPEFTDITVVGNGPAQAEASAEISILCRPNG